jgi:hypothetical protein
LSAVIKQRNPAPFASTAGFSALILSGDEAIGKAVAGRFRHRTLRPHERASQTDLHRG